jgi:prevent-host-death family protein
MHELQAETLELFRRVEESGEELVITENGRPVSRVVPLPPKCPSLSCSPTFAVASSTTKTFSPRRRSGQPRDPLEHAKVRP